MNRAKVESVFYVFYWFYKVFCRENMGAFDYQSEINFDSGCSFKLFVLKFLISCWSTWQQRGTLSSDFFQTRQSSSDEKALRALP